MRDVCGRGRSALGCLLRRDFATASLPLPSASSLHVPPCTETVHAGTPWPHWCHHQTCFAALQGKGQRGIAAIAAITAVPTITHAADPATTEPRRAA